MSSTDQLQPLREKIKQSRAKIWIRTGLLTIFSVLFGAYLVRDVSSGVFRWEWGLAVFVFSRWHVDEPACTHAGTIGGGSRTLI